MNTARKTRRPFRAQITKLSADLHAMCIDPNVDKKALKLKMIIFEDMNTKMGDLDSVVIEKAVEENKTDAEVDVEMQSILDYKQKVEETREEVSQVLQTVGATNSGIPVPVAAQRSFKLPKIQLKTFNGNLKDWLGFWSQFQKIHNDGSLHASDKFQYLVQAMAENTEARELVLSYPLSEDNYPKAVDALKKRYANNDLLLQVYVRELLNLVITNVTAKEKIPFTKMYIQLESHLRSLKSLNLEKADPATWIYPLVESSLNGEVLLAWQRSPLSSKDGSTETPPKTRLDYLMEFLEGEVQIQQKINLAQSSFQLNPVIPKVEVGKKENKNKTKDNQVATLSGMYNGESSSSCVFCSKSHESKECFVAQTMTHEEKKNKLKEKKCCFRCFSFKHGAKGCKAKLRCILCGNSHLTLMCPDVDNRKKSESKSKGKEDNADSSKETCEVSTGFMNHLCSSQVMLHTIMVDAIGPKGQRKIRAFIDPGSQRSYVLKTLAQELGLQNVGEENVIHSLFGGNKTAVVSHRKYDLKLQRPGGGFSCLIKVRDQERICGGIPRISRKSNTALFAELKRRQIWISDVGEDAPPIEVLLGDDVYGKLLTGKIVQLDCGLTATETKLGWALHGEQMVQSEEPSAAMSVLNMAVADVSVTDLWNLETIGIRDPVEVQSAAEKDAEAKEEFLRTLQRKEDGRYSVKLPWAKGHPPLPSNYDVALRRLKSTTRKLINGNSFEAYKNIFSQWEEEGIIERVSAENRRGKVHYVPHRPVFKLESLTTPVRPVFDGSCKIGKLPSLNDCLVTGPSYIQKVPDLLLLFRERRIGVISDIRKAFQMIEVQEEDRDALRFLWWEDYSKEEVKVYRHTRVMFGATCSPFILGAVLEYHLTHVDQEDEPIAKKLLQSLFVDNFVTSVDTIDEMETFKEGATRIMAAAKMDLRMWMCTDETSKEDTAVASVLGLKWDRRKDTLSVITKPVPTGMKITKRNILSLVHKIYDPIGFTVPAVIPMKMMLQEAWVNRSRWDEELPEIYAAKLERLSAGLQTLSKVEIPRNFNGFENDRSKWSIHTLTDASAGAYACVTYLRVDHGEEVTVQLLAASSRVAPLQRMTIPRLELLGCVIGSRLTNNVKKALAIEDVPEYYWSDSSTALAWIRRDNKWATWVGNRVTGINSLTKAKDWRHVPGVLNSADLPSRGCSTEDLLCSKWWEGPVWLKEQCAYWPKLEEPPEEPLVAAEMKKCDKQEVTLSVADILMYKGTYHRYVRVCAWIYRFISNCKEGRRIRQSSIKNVEGLSLEEKVSAEKKIVKMIQQQSFPEGQVPGIQVIKDEDGILRVKTRIVLKEDTKDFRYPVLLPHNHPLVTKLIQDFHVRNCHVGVTTSMCMLREKYWILKARRTIKSVLSRCPRCRRHAAQNITVDVAPLPADRINDADIFQVIGVDLAGPLLVKGGKKVWICIFTCAVFRAVHLEVVKSLSTRAFLQALQKFIRLHGRPSVIYSDNGTNFVGANSLFRKLNWEKIEAEEDIKPIRWKFNPPSAAWWGGWWERLIRVMKDLRKRMIGKATLSQVELEASVQAVEEIMNQRPLTYVSEDPEELAPLTPAMFMRRSGLCKFPEGKLLDGEMMRFRWKYLQTLEMELRQRFRREYLSTLIAKGQQKKCRALKVGEVVFVCADNRKRIEWPLGRVMEVIPGKDGIVRVVRVKTQDGELLRPIQRIFPLELDWSDEDKSDAESKRTRYGRRIKAPDRLKL